VFLATAGLRGDGAAEADEAAGAEADGATAVRISLPGDRQRIREYACISLLDLLRRQLLATQPADAR